MAPNFEKVQILTFQPQRSGPVGPLFDRHTLRRKNSADSIKRGEKGLTPARIIL